MTNIKKGEKKKKREILAEEKCLPFKFHTSCSDSLNQLICVLGFFWWGGGECGCGFCYFFDPCRLVGLIYFASLCSSFLGPDRVSWLRTLSSCEVPVCWGEQPMLFLCWCRKVVLCAVQCTVSFKHLTLLRSHQLRPLSSPDYQFPAILIRVRDFSC